MLEPSIPDLPMEDFRQIGRDMELPGVGQIGYMVEDIETASEMLGPRLGVKTWYRPRIVKQKLLYKEDPIESKLKIAVGYTGFSQVELVQHEPGRNSLFEISSAGQKDAPHHLGFFVRNLQAHRSRLAHRGMQSVQHGSIWFAKGHRTRVAYFDARNTLGHMIELIEHRVQGFYLGMPEWYVKLGALTGHVERLHR